MPTKKSLSSPHCPHCFIELEKLYIHARVYYSLVLDGDQLYATDDIIENEDVLCCVNCEKPLGDELNIIINV